MLSRADDNKTQSTILPSHLAAAVVPAPQLNDNYRPTRWTSSLLSFSASPLVQTHSAPCYTSVAHTYTVITDPFNGPLSGTTRPVPIWILLKQETVSGSAISWVICKSAPRYRPLTTAQFFYRPDALPAAQPTASKH